MEQINNVLPVIEEEIQPAVLNSKKRNSHLLSQVRQKFSFFGTISLVFGIGFSCFFYKAGIGFNTFAFTLVMVSLLYLIMNKLQIPLKKVTYLYFLGAVLLGLSSVLTSSENLQFINIVGILLLLETAILHQLHNNDKWNFTKHFASLFGLAISSIAAIGMPFVDSFHFMKNTRLMKTDRSRNITYGIVIAIPLLWVLIALLSSADLLFGEMTKNVYKFLFSPNIVNVSFMIIIGFIISYSIICGATGRVLEIEHQKNSKKADPAIAVTALTLIFLVYAIFSGIQIIYLFTNGLLTLPEEFTFAEYARRGFFELLAVTGINLVLMLICTSLFRESKSLRIVLTGITACTYIMIVSAVYRMLLYIDAYHLTFLRLFVLLFLLIDALVLVGIIYSVYQTKFQLFRYCVIVVSICYIIFSFARPDYFIASYQIKHKEELNAEDIIYLTKELSLDAAPIVLLLLSDTDTWSTVALNSDQLGYDRYISPVLLEDYTERYYDMIRIEKEKRGIRDYNYSIVTAAKYAEQYPKYNTN